MEPEMSWRAYFRIVTNFILSMVVTVIVGNIFDLRLALHPTDAEKAAKLNELAIGDPYTAHPAWWIGIIILAVLMLRDIANGINRAH
jgi:ABC-type sugar transport system permease subunit